MRKIDKPFRPIPEKLYQCFEAKQENLLAKKENHSFDGNCYNTAVKKELEILYHSKCAFCESKLNAIPKDNYEFTVEHFRPKKGGWYWLAYEWSNLMPSCRKCNEAKADHFSIDKRKKQNLPLITDSEGKEIIDLSRCIADCEELLAENALLLQPEVDNPMDFLAFDLEKLGYFVDDSKQKRAKYTLDLCKLNRSDLFERRKSIYDTFLTTIKDKLIELLEIYGNQYTDKELKFGFHSIFDKMYEGAEKEQSEYYSFRYFLLTNFDRLFLEKMPTPEMREILKNAFLLFLKKK
jgi:uncharacterized protein (TIGR02646 family)